MESLLLECAVRSALIATATAVVLWAMRIKTAATRHAAWTAVVVAMLLLPIWSAAGLKVSLRVLRPMPSPIDIAADPANVIPNAAAQSGTTPPDAPAGGDSAQGVNWHDLLVDDSEREGQARVHTGCRRGEPHRSSPDPI